MLECFATGPITQSLEALTIQAIVRPSDFSRLYTLRRLRRLDLICGVSLHLDGGTIADLFPPCPFLPSLTELAWHEGADETKFKRQGPSFEWMQQRLAQ